MSDELRTSVTDELTQAYQIIGALVDALYEGKLGELLESGGADRDVTISEGHRARRAIDAFAQQFGIDVEAAT
jgi:hypothetical protein